VRLHADASANEVPFPMKMALFQAIAGIQVVFACDISFAPV
jgi:hypothetical protein